MLPRLFFFSQENNKSLGWYHAFLGQINAINHNCKDICWRIIWINSFSSLIYFGFCFCGFVAISDLDENFVFVQ